VRDAVELLELAGDFVANVASKGRANAAKYDRKHCHCALVPPLAGGDHMTATTPKITPTKPNPKTQATITMNFNISALDITTR